MFFVFLKNKRTRDPRILQTCKVLVDVGCVYDPENLRFDHHQPGFDKTSKHFGLDYNIPLSSAGLVYMHFGKEIIKILAPEVLPEDVLNIIWKKIYQCIILEIDAIDNGIECSEEMYKIRTHLSARISRLNPNWANSKECDSNTQFYKAMELAGKEFLEQVEYFTRQWWPARKFVEEAFQQQKVYTFFLDIFLDIFIYYIFNTIL